MHGNRDEAQSELRKAADTCAKNHLEYIGAVADLKRAF